MATSVATPGKPGYIDANETTLTIRWDPVDCDAYHVQHKQPHQAWSEAIELYIEGQNSLEVRVVDLLPQTTYELRVVAEKDGKRSEPGPQISLDTAAIDCGPKKRRCVVS
uniref:Fibronectin type-III domain-containing protein n=1 Tax=Pinguiococcus pyrenoidosus TaxID=172671 RepID=A0A7R9UFC2_9STRA|mmetsp:Transcript_8734/g.32912  ORF Transcript_8734/g.32912 Transcript_8734/m.32912 type:complete len:110 (+) Transcript_8734:144-473(+)